MREWDNMVLVGRVARPHGIRGDVVVSPETDFADERFAVGASLWTRVAGVVEQGEVARGAVGGERPVVGVGGASGRADAERRGGGGVRVAGEGGAEGGAGGYAPDRLSG